MDERVNEGYQKIRSELFVLILIVCCISVVVKIAFMGMSTGDCIPEFPIMIASPLYMAVRSHMLGITQVTSPTKKAAKQRRIALAIGLAVFLLVFTATARSHGGETDWREVVLFGVAFLLFFPLAQFLFLKLEKRRQHKLDSHYDDPGSN